MVTFWAIIMLMLAFSLGTLQGMSPEMRKAMLAEDEEEAKDGSIAWLVLLAAIATIYLGILGI